MEFKKQMSKKIQLLFNINTYLNVNDMFFYKGNLYIKNQNTKYTYIYLGDYFYLIRNANKIISNLIENFPQTLGITDTFGDLFDNLKYVESIIKNNVDDSLVSKKINFNVIEFNDGIYIMEYDKFFSTKEVNTLLKNNNQIRCTRYYNQNYLTTLKQTRNLLPKIWLKYLGKNVDDTTEFCTKFGKYFFQENDVNIARDRKKNSMFIRGKSSTGKTMLLTNALINRWGMEHISMMTDNSNFTFENIQKNKNLIIQDEFEYQKKHRSGILKMLDNQPMAVNIKYQKSSIQTHNAPIILLGNPTKNNATMLEDAAFEKRLDVYEFSEELEVTTEEVEQIKG